MKLRFILIILATLTVIVNADDASLNGTETRYGASWAFLVAGSNGYCNYRHQADVCHAYQILKKNGIADENIIIMMYDDIGDSVYNPTPGVIVHKPNGPDVYENVKIDYKGTDVNAKNFLAVLQGNISEVSGGSGRVIQSGANDTVFVYFSGYGCQGYWNFPDSLLSSHDLETAFKNMEAKKTYTKIVFYVDTAAAGSMFDHIILDNSRIFSMTATGPYENNWVCRWDSSRGVYLADQFSANWMEYSETKNLINVTIHHHFQYVRRKTNSMVQEYGNLELGSTILAEILGGKNATNNRDTSSLKGKPESRLLHLESEGESTADAVLSLDVPLATLENKISAVGNPESRKELLIARRNLLHARSTVDTIINNIVKQVTKGDETLARKYSVISNDLTKQNRECYEKAVKYFDQKCFKLSKNSYILRHLFVFINMCSSKDSHLQDIRTAIDKSCKGIEISDVI